ncbi:MAG: TlpA disulfide reductase family protein [Acidobacteriota bacterium]
MNAHTQSSLPQTPKTQAPGKNTADKLLVGSIVLMVVALGWVISGSLEERVVKVGDKAPEFTFKTDSGKTITPTSFGGKLLVLNFWAAWCQPCVVEVPSLEQFSRALGPQGVVVLGVSMDANPKLYEQFRSRFDVTFETAREPDWKTSSQYGTFQIPETYIIDQSGKVVQKIISAQDWMNPAFLDSVKKLL